MGHVLDYLRDEKRELGPVHRSDDVPTVLLLPMHEFIAPIGRSVRTRTGLPG